MVSIPEALLPYIRGGEERLAVLSAEARQHQRRALADLAGDDETRETLLELWDAAGPLDHDALTVALVLRWRGRRIMLHAKRTRETALLIFEVFVGEGYVVDGNPPSRIYDFGAHIGIAALQMHAMWPGTEIVCIEPNPESAALLDENLRVNRVNARVLRAAISARPQAKLLMRSSLSALSEAGSIVERVTPLDVVEGDAYGLKIDVEGAEHQCDWREVFARARFAVGELHLGPRLVAVERAHDFEAALRARFTHVDLTSPGIFEDTLTRSFRAV